MSISHKYPGKGPEDIPYGYSMYRSVLDDGAGYAPKVVDSWIGDNGRRMILISLSPGVYTTATLISSGQYLDGMTPEVDDILREFQDGQRSAE